MRSKLPQLLVAARIERAALFQLFAAVLDNPGSTPSSFER
jgi:hypothetical protein